MRHLHTIDHNPWLRNTTAPERDRIHTGGKRGTGIPPTVLTGSDGVTTMMTENENEKEDTTTTTEDMGKEKEGVTMIHTLT